MMQTEIAVGAYYRTVGGILVHALGGNAERDRPDAHWVVTILDNSQAVESPHLRANRVGALYSVDLHGGVIYSTVPGGWHGNKRSVAYDDPFALKERVYLTTEPPRQIEGAVNSPSEESARVSGPSFRLDFYIPPALSVGKATALNVHLDLDAPGLVFTGAYPDEPAVKEILRAAMKALLRQMVKDGSAFIDPDAFFAQMGIRSDVL